MSIQTLAALENAAGPYLRAGYVVTVQTESAITMRPPEREFSWWLFAAGLLLLWPAAVVYLARANQRRGRVVCVRVTSQGGIEASGFTLDHLERESRSRFPLTPSRVVVLLLLLGIIGGLLFIIAASKG